MVFARTAFTTRAELALTVTVPEPRAPVLPAITVPPLMLKPPLNELAAFKLSVPAPVFVTRALLGLPPLSALANSTVLPDGISKAALEAALKLTRAETSSVFPFSQPRVAVAPTSVAPSVIVDLVPNAAMPNPSSPFWMSISG